MAGLRSTLGEKETVVKWMSALLMLVGSVAVLAQEPPVVPSVLDDEPNNMEVPEFETKGNPDSLLFYEAHLDLLDEALKDRKRIKDAKTEQARTKLDLDRDQKLFKQNALSQEDLDNSQADYEVAKAELKIAQAILEERKINVDIAVIQEKEHLGQPADFSQLKQKYSQRWTQRKKIVELTIGRARSELVRQNARFARAKHLHGKKVETTEAYQHIKAARYVAEHGLDLAEKRLALLTKICDAYAK